MIIAHNIEEISFSDHSILIKIDGLTKEIPLEKISIKLEKATELQRKIFTISPSGYGIHWPLIDEDLSLDHILKLAL